MDNHLERLLYCSGWLSNVSRPNVLQLIVQFHFHDGICQGCIDSLHRRRVTTLGHFIDQHQPEGVDIVRQNAILRQRMGPALIEQEQPQLDLFDVRNLLELSSPDYPGERLMACRNRWLANVEPAFRTLKAVDLKARPLAGDNRVHAIIGEITGARLEILSGCAR